jgi:hypothetical protein
VRENRIEAVRIRDRRETAATATDS